MAAPEERLLSEGEGGALGSARLSPPPVSESPEALAPLEPPPQSNTLMGLPIVAIESILSFLSYDETSQLRLNLQVHFSRRRLPLSEVSEICKTRLDK